MASEDFSEQMKRLETLLREVQPLISSGQDKILREKLNTVYSILFKKSLYEEIWDEGLLLQLQNVFEVMKPNEEIFGDKINVLTSRSATVSKINDLFFAILGPDTPTDRVEQVIAEIADVDIFAFHKLRSTDKLGMIRKSESRPSEKIEGFLNHLAQDLSMDFGEKTHMIEKCLANLKRKEAAGKVNALLVDLSENTGTLIPVQVKLQPGDGRVAGLVWEREDFAKAVKRAQHAVLEYSLLRPGDVILYSLDVTTAQYQGESIALAAAVGIYCAARDQVMDCYTGFTGDVNLEDDQFRVKGIKGVNKKLEAALLYGCRRVFIPAENMEEINDRFQAKLGIIGVTNILEVLTYLQSPTERLPGDTLQARKTNLLKSICEENGWHLSPPRPIDFGVNFTVSRIVPPDLTVSIYTTGKHSPKMHATAEYRQLLNALNELDKPPIPIQKVELSLEIKDLDLRTQIRAALDQLQPTESRDEKYCNYFYRFERENERLIVKQFQKGKLQIQGSAGGLYQEILEVIVTRYNLRYPNAQLKVGAFIQKQDAGLPSVEKSFIVSHEEIPLPYIGTDESGKGDYFGPMVIAGVFVDEKLKKELESMGVKDSKLLSDKRCRELANDIRKISKGKYEEVELLPERYNALYEEFKREGKKLNHLLAWGHARAIESLLKRFKCNHAVADQFGDEKYITSKLMQEGKKINLVQTSKGERYIGVAASSILARDRFLERMDKLSQEYEMTLPKGASSVVIEYAKKIAEGRGKNELSRVVKLHHKTTQRILE